METNSAKKELAIKLRKQGKSIGYIEKKLGINRSTLSGWFKNVILSEAQKEKLYNDWLKSLEKARLAAAAIHRKNRLARIRKIAEEVNAFISRIELNEELGQLLFAVFYLAEGTKTEGQMSFANSNPNLLKAVLGLFRSVYQPNESKFRCCLHLRKDQPEKQLKTFWSKQLNIPESQFIKSQFDDRTRSRTYKHYKGVCVVYYYDTATQRRVMFIGNTLVNKWSHEYNSKVSMGG